MCDGRTCRQFRRSCLAGRILAEGELSFLAAAATSQPFLPICHECNFPSFFSFASRRCGLRTDQIHGRFGNPCIEINSPRVVEDESVPQRSVNPFGLVVLITCSSGCSLFQPLAHQDAQSNDRPQSTRADVNRLETSPFDEQDEQRTLETDQLKPGQHVQLITGENLSGSHPDPTSAGTALLIAGTVKSIDGGRVVLHHAAVLDSDSTVRGATVINKLPYISRVVKNTGAFLRGTPIPGEVTIERSEILRASEITEEWLQSIRNSSGDFERIAVDFDLAVEANE